METERRGGRPDSSTEAADTEMRARAEGLATVRDPLSDVTIGITKQCVNVSLSCDGGAEVGPPRPHCPARGSNTPRTVRGHAVAVSTAGRHSRRGPLCAFTAR